MAIARARRGDSGMNYWPGFVDALSTLILGIIFLLTVFVVVQFYLTQEVTGKDTALTRLNAQIAQEIYALRTRAGLTQKQLAELVGTTDSVISRLEDADYTGHSLKMLQRISAALHRRLEIHFVPLRARRKSA